MTTHIVGARTPKPLGLRKSKYSKQVTSGQMHQLFVVQKQYYVVPNTCALAMQGWKANKSKTGKITVYAVKSTYAEASTLCTGWNARFKNACVVSF